MPTSVGRPSATAIDYASGYGSSSSDDSPLQAVSHYYRPTCACLAATRLMPN
jgi:hypothetical protein